MFAILISRRFFADFKYNLTFKRENSQVEMERISSTFQAISNTIWMGMGVTDICTYKRDWVVGQGTL